MSHTLTFGIFFNDFPILSFEVLSKINIELVASYFFISGQKHLTHSIAFSMFPLNYQTVN